MAKRGRKSKQQISDEFKNMVAAATGDDLKTRVVSLSKDEESIFKARDEDSALTEAKDQAKELGAPYGEALKDVRIKRRYVLKVLNERGQ